MHGGDAVKGWLAGLRYRDEKERAEIIGFLQVYDFEKLCKRKNEYKSGSEKQWAYRERKRKAKRRMREERNRRRRMKRMQEQIDSGRVYTRSQIRELRNWQAKNW